MRAGTLRIAGIAGFVAALLAPSLLACAGGPGALERAQVENELLREELRIVRSNCSYYRDVEMGVDEDSPPGAR